MNMLHAFGLAVGLGLLASPGITQTETTPTETAQPDLTPQTPANENEAAMTTDAGAEPNVTAETYGDWVVRCVTPQVGTNDAAANDIPQICEMTQEHNDRASGRRVLALGIRATDSGAHLTVVAPFGLKLSEGVRLDNETGYQLQLQFHTCLPAGCIVSHDLSDDEIAELTSQPALAATLISTDSSELGVTLSTNGMQEAWESLKG